RIADPAGAKLPHAVCGRAEHREMGKRLRDFFGTFDCCEVSHHVSLSMPARELRASVMALRYANFGLAVNKFFLASMGDVVRMPKAPNERSREWRPGLRAGSGLAVYWQRVVATPARTVVVQVTGWGTLTVGAGGGL